MIALPDVNVLLALAWNNHPHHEPAHEWLNHKQDRMGHLSFHAIGIYAAVVESAGVTVHGSDIHGVGKRGKVNIPEVFAASEILCCNVCPIACTFCRSDVLAICRTRKMP